MKTLDQSCSDDIKCFDRMVRDGMNFIYYGNIYFKDGERNVTEHLGKG